MENCSSPHHYGGESLFVRIICKNSHLSFNTESWYSPHSLIWRVTTSHIFYSVQSLLTAECYFQKIWRTPPSFKGTMQQKMNYACRALLTKNIWTISTQENFSSKVVWYLCTAGLLDIRNKPPILLNLNFLLRFRTETIVLPQCCRSRHTTMTKVTRLCYYFSFMSHYCFSSDLCFFTVLCSLFHAGTESNREYI